MKRYDLCVAIARGFELAQAEQLNELIFELVKTSNNYQVKKSYDYYDAYGNSISAEEYVHKAHSYLVYGEITVNIEMEEEK